MERVGLGKLGWCSLSGGGEVIHKRNALFNRHHLYTVAQVGVVLAWFVFLRPAALGGPASYVIVSGSSMEPTLSGGDFVLALQQDDYRIGDLVAFRVPAGEPGEGAAVIHRIVGRQAEGFVTQGDNSDRPDTWHPGAQDILGRMRFSLPGGGRWVEGLRRPVVLGAIAGILGMSFVLVGGKPRRQEGRPAAQPSRDRLGGADWDRLLMKDSKASEGDFTIVPSGPPRGAPAARPVPRDRAIPTKDLLRWSRLNRRVVLRHPLPAQAEVFVEHSGNRTHWVVSAKGEVLSDKAEEDGES